MYPQTKEQFWGCPILKYIRLNKQPMLQHQGAVDLSVREKEIIAGNSLRFQKENWTAI